jgi:elongation factor Ts
LGRAGEARGEKEFEDLSMATITAGLVKDLREKTGAGMMDCKNALSETDGDIEAAVDWLRKKGLAKAAKKSGRVAAEGLVGVAVEDNVGVVAELNSETDFVARNDDFQALARGVVAVALDKAPHVDVETVLGAHYMGGGTVAEAIQNAIATIGENITLRRVQGLRVSEGAVGRYVHSQLVDGLGRIGVIVALESKGNRDALASLGRQLAMHVAAASPIALNSEGVDPAIVARERSVLAEKNAGKPPNVLEKIVESGLKTFYKEVCLLDQPFVHDPAKSVAQAVKDAEKAAGAPIAVTGFVRYALGEGVEKPADEA